jgi:hypothetical protein
VKRSNVAVGFGVLACGLALMLWTRPSHFHVERTRRIAASPEALYARVVDFAEWPAWTPWRETAQNCTPEPGVGATCHGGTAQFMIVRADPARRVDIELSFPGRWEETAMLSVAFAPAGDDTDVTFSFDASTWFCDREFGLFRDMSGRLDREFARALGALAGEAPPEDDGPH